MRKTTFTYGNTLGESQPPLLLEPHRLCGAYDLVLLETTLGQRLSPLQHPQSLRMETSEQVSPCGPMLYDTYRN